jgi:hypothetical protein
MPGSTGEDAQGSRLPRSVPFPAIASRVVSNGDRRALRDWAVIYHCRQHSLRATLGMLFRGMGFREVLDARSDKHFNPTLLI